MKPSSDKISPLQQVTFHSYMDLDIDIEQELQFNNLSNTSCALYKTQWLLLSQIIVTQLSTEHVHQWSL